MTLKAQFFSLLICLSAISAHSQQFRKGINKDSLFQVILATFPEHMKVGIERLYKNGSQMEKDVLLIWYSDPVVTIDDLIKNIDSNFHNIKELSREFNTLAPVEYEVYIEVTLPSRIYESEETFDIRITPVKGSIPLFQKWGMTVKSEELKQALSILRWDGETLNKVKTLLQAANCVSIKNGETITIGFARMGLGKYSFKLFPNNIPADQVKKYNDGCRQIYYKDNIVLEYGGGAVGPQCFPGK